MVALLGIMQAKADVIINEVNFPDENFRTILLYKNSLDGKDVVLTDATIKGFQYLDVSHCEIKSLKGIEFFTALTYLNCYDNLLTSLDVSKNTALDYLYCDNNQLTSIDVSMLMNLHTLSCSNNQLKSLDISNNTAWLRELYCSNNQLTSINVSNKALETLYCHNNQLISLDVSKDTKLKTLCCYGNQLTSLDVSKNTELISLYCYGNQIKSSAMDVLVESLPIGSENDMKWYNMYVIYNEDEGNEITTEQIAVVKAKDWIPWYYDGTDWKEYEGSTNIEKLKNSKIEELKYYDLNGQETLQPRKGINIVKMNDGKTKKVVVK
jgi:Leucine Rich Repeat.